MLVESFNGPVILPDWLKGSRAMENSLEQYLGACGVEWHNTFR